ncbi:helix-turn-helix transcriptional regulator [Holdemania massiliensis]|uniref:Helix-turn-helix domain-containing protein n=1 Tax=Holdemania massiliensis TaxID=1468449 RepID=A0A6N7SBQ6_9FIRM|nr:helix-turn-helix transcriptional regulator [Holdemania massiliensis]MSA72775.1 helix-turn-helix domain-containing protein [Holdemania massiliensis]MSA91040.1 helix-turn-helix domain-containing protein [Holdemania massiliensis]MSB79890.1 helix-turn-helix domain-containing protein [Holdemania massiliensis]MSC34811.1 helix-turn-helix domain-containing protein [Holdemania massiliensis]MSC41200.1 helix-turn-helix domain-containing protein [Holdemania massiliensis]
MLKDRIKELRKSCDLKQDALAAKLDVSQATIGYWETGKRSPSLAKVKKMEKIFNTKDGELVTLALLDRIGNKTIESLEETQISEKINYPSEVQEIIDAMMNVDNATQKKILAGAKAFVPEAFVKYPEGYKYPIGFVDAAAARRYYEANSQFAPSSSGEEPIDEEIILLANELYEEQKAHKK